MPDAGQGRDAGGDELSVVTKVTLAGLVLDVVVHVEPYKQLT